MDLYLDRYNLFDGGRPDKLQNGRDDEHLLAEFSGPKQAYIAGIGHINKSHKRWRHCQEHNAGDAPLACKGFHLSQDLEPLTNEVADLVENLGKVAAGGALDNDRRHEEAHVHRGHALGQAAQGVLDWYSKILLFINAAKFKRDGRRHLFGDNVHARSKTVSSPQCAA